MATTDPSTNSQLARPAPLDPYTSLVRPNLPPLPKKFAGLQVRQPSEVRQYKGWSCGLSGRGGVGKSTLAASLINSPLAHNCLYVDIEGGAFVIDNAEDHPRYLPEEGPHLGIVDVFSFSQLEAIMQNLIINFKKDGIYSAVFDNMSEALELSKIKHGFYTTDKNMRLSIWDDITNDMIQLFRMGRDLARQEQFICVFVMWDTDRLTEAGNPKSDHKRDVSLNPKLAEKFIGIMDHVAWLETPDKPKPPYPPIMHFDIDPSIPTKKRMNPKQQRILGIPDVIYQPDLGDIVNTVVGGLPWPTHLHIDKPAARPTAEILAERRAKQPNAPTTTPEQ